MAKSINHRQKNPTSKKAPKKIQAQETKIFEEHRSVITGEIVILELQKFIDEMFAYARNNPTARLCHFIHSKNMARDTFYGWCERVPRLKAALKEFNLMIADARAGILIEKCDTGFLRQSLSFYDDEWKQFDNERNQSKNNITTTFSGKIIDLAKADLKNESENNE